MSTFLKGNDFEKAALDLHITQYKSNSVYHSFCRNIGLEEPAQSFLEIPFLPISFFKHHAVKSGEFEAEKIFLSSGTGGRRSMHHIKSLDAYRESLTRSFQFFHPPENGRLAVFALLPNYLEQGDSSLIYMIDELNAAGSIELKGYFLHDSSALYNALTQAIQSGNQTCLLFGVSYALLDFAEQYSLNLEEHIVMETGGMKGRREELIRSELHERLKKAFNTKQIASEYGMTELMSQAYSRGEGIYECPPWMQVSVRDIYDPFALQANERSGVLRFIDLANEHSCAFIETDDLGRVHENGKFEVLGRLDASDVRGCNLLAI